MRNIRLTIEYRGTNYSGFQKQPNVRTIQGVIEDTLKTILSENITTIGAGRTDAGVHAYGQVINFRTNSEISLKKLQWSANCLFPNDIVIKKAENVNETFNSRRDATAREYIYQILNRSYGSAFLGEISLFFPWKLNISAMQKATKHLLATHDFSSFCQHERGVEKNTVKTVQSANLHQQDDLIVFSIKADSFLYNMVRIITGTLLEVGTGKKHPDDLQEILESNDRSRAGETVSAQGLILKSVFYPKQ